MNSNSFLRTNQGEHTSGNPAGSLNLNDMTWLGSQICLPIGYESQSASMRPLTVSAVSEFHQNSDCGSQIADGPCKESQASVVDDQEILSSDDQAHTSNGRDDCQEASDSTSDTENSFDKSTAAAASGSGIKFYSRNDVLCGRGGGTNVHPGNRRFRDLINANRRSYLKARKNDKPAISRSIVRTIHEMNGRFLKKDENNGVWVEISDDEAREKTSQALRQRAPEMRKILFDDEQRIRQEQLSRQLQQTALMQRSLLNQSLDTIPRKGEIGNNGGSLMQRSFLNQSLDAIPRTAEIGNNGDALMQRRFLNQSLDTIPRTAESRSNGDTLMQRSFLNQTLDTIPRTTEIRNLSDLQGLNFSPYDLNLSNMSNLANYAPDNARLAMLQLKNYFAQQEAFKTFARSGSDPSRFSGQQNQIDNLTRQTLFSQSLKPIIPRGA